LQFRLEPAPGGTTFIWIEDFQPPLGPLVDVAPDLFRVGPDGRAVAVVNETDQGDAREAAAACPMAAITVIEERAA
jgi:hypothetical protein